MFNIRLSIHFQAESLVKAQQDMADTMGELGLSFIKLTKFENEEAILDTQRERAAEMKNIATAAVKGSRVYRELNARTVKNLVIFPLPSALCLLVLICSYNPLLTEICQQSYWCLLMMPLLL